MSEWSFNILELHSSLTYLDAKLGTFWYKRSERRCLRSCSQYGYETWSHRKRMHNVAAEEGAWAIHQDLQNMCNEKWVEDWFKCTGRCRYNRIRNGSMSILSCTGRFYHWKLPIKGCLEKAEYDWFTRGTKNMSTSFVTGFLQVNNDCWYNPPCLKDSCQGWNESRAEIKSNSLLLKNMNSTYSHFLI